MTPRAKFAHWIVLASVVYCVGGYVAAGVNGSWIDIAAIIIWSFLAFMVHQRPGSWGFGVSIFLLLLVPVQAGLWLLAVTRLSAEQKIAQGVNDSWLKFVLSVLPLLAGGVSGIALRRLLQTQQVQPQP